MVYELYTNNDVTKKKNKETLQTPGKKKDDDIYPSCYNRYEISLGVSMHRT